MAAHPVAWHVVSERERSLVQTYEPVSGELEHAELSVLLTNDRVIRSLNQEHRGKDRPTDVLAFPLDDGGEAAPLLGDVVICAPVVAAEAAMQGQPPDAHWAHLVIHGILHLLGYDHHQDADAARMERRESALLTGLGFPDPW